MSGKDCAVVLVASTRFARFSPHNRLCASIHLGEIAVRGWGCHSWRARHLAGKRALPFRANRLAFYVETCIVIPMSSPLSYTLSITDASAKGVSALVHDAETGGVVVLERRHEPVAAVIGVQRLEILKEAERDLRDLGIVLTRAATDDGVRHTLSDVFERFGFDRAALEAELDEDLTTGLE